MSANGRPTVLVAVSCDALATARSLLGDAFEQVPVLTLGEARERLGAGDIDVILAGLHFDDSVMPMLLDAVRADPRTRATPFVCARFLPTLLPNASLRAARQVCDALGAQEFVDVLELSRRDGAPAAAAILRGALRRACLASPDTRAA